MAHDIPPTGGDLPPAGNERGAEGPGHAGIPAPDDLAGWKAADMRLAKRFAEHLLSDRRLASARAVTRYFGVDDLEHYFATHEQLCVKMAYAAWGVLDYRPNHAAQTRAEQMLAGGLPADEALLLRARMEAHPTLYRIAAHDAGAGTVDFEDVLLGGTVTVYDRRMAEHIDDGLYLAARAFAAGNFHFMEPAGPLLGAGMGVQAVEYLRHCGMEFTRAGQVRDAHLFGRLWDWMDEWEANWQVPQLRNMDGDELVWHTASFSMADEQQVRAALEKRPDIRCDDEAHEYVWWREAGDDPLPGDTVTLGRIELLGEELVLSVNSARRLAAARKWLEQVPGVAFKAVKTRRLEKPDKDRPLDERIAKPAPVQVTPEMARAIEGLIRKQYTKWLDTPLPALNGQTPRQACRTPEGRQQVTILIRTIPDPMGPVPFKVPRQEMLRELGLEAGPPEKAGSSPCSESKL